MSPGKIVFGVVPSKNDNRCPRQSSSSSFYFCLLCLPLCHARCLSFRLKLCWEIASHSVLRVCCRIFFFLLLCFMYFLSHLVSMLGL